MVKLPVDPPNEGIRSQKSNRSSQQEVDCTCQEAVTEEKESGYKSGDMKFEHVIPNTVGKDPEGTAATCQEASPPPVVVLEKGLAGTRSNIRALGDTYLRAKLVIGCDNSHFYHSDHQYSRDCT